MIIAGSSLVRGLLKHIGAIALAGGVASCGGGGDSGADAARQLPQAAKSAPEASVAPCTGCVFGPVTFKRQTGQPKVEAFQLHGDPNADYVVEIDDNASQGENAVVTLDGAELPAHCAGNSRCHVLLDVKLKALSEISVRLTGKPGSSVTVSVRGGTKVVGRAGGSVTSPGGNVRLDIPPGALPDNQIVSISAAGPEISGGRLGNFAMIIEPSGINFNVPVTITVKYDLGIVPPDAPETALTLAYVTDLGLTDIPTEVDTVNHTLKGLTTHFSIWVISATSTPGYQGLSRYVEPATWLSSNNCLKRPVTEQMKGIEALSRAIFGLPPTTDFQTVGCVTEPYLANGYSYDTYAWDSGSYSDGTKHAAIGLENHAGIDFRAPEGSIVNAFVNGTIIVSGVDDSIGKSTLIIESIVGGKAYWIFYLHCRSHMGLVPGQSVRAGQQVCESGKVGAAAAHLHFEVKLKGVDVDANNNDRLKAMAGSHCPGSTFQAYNPIGGLFNRTAAGCTKEKIAQLTVDPADLFAALSPFTQIDYPGGIDTQLWDINQSGVIVGNTTVGGRTVGFKYSNGSSTILPAPFGAASYVATGISNSGLIVGVWCSATNCVTSGINAGFILEAGVYSSFSVPGASQTNLRGVSPDGRYFAGDCIFQGTAGSGFVYDRTTRNFSFISQAGGLVVAQGINSSGQVVGSTIGVDGFIYDVRTATRTRVSVPGFSDASVRPRAINDLGQLGGALTGSAKVFYGTPGNFQIFDIPGATGAFIYGNNTLGQHVGYFSDAAGRIHGFILTR